MRSALVSRRQLHASGGWLVQPFSVNGTEPSAGPQWYGSGDFHDANRVNNKRQIPILLERCFSFWLTLSVAAETSTERACAAAHKSPDCGMQRP